MNLPDDFLPLFAPGAPDGDALCFGFIGDELVLVDHTLPTPAQLAALGPAEFDCTIGVLAGTPCRLLCWRSGTPVPAPLTAHGLRPLHGVLAEFWIAARAKQLASWLRDHRHCGHCGTPTVLATDHEMARVCPACGHRMYPRVSPAMMVLIHRGRELLLARSPHFKPGVYSALAGFVEPGETLEACVHRETLEEVGVTITNLRWFASQSWPFPHSLMLAFHADYVGGDIVPQPNEIEDARWFSVDALPELPTPASIARRLIDDAVAELRG